MEKRWPQLKALEVEHKLRKEIFEWEEIVDNEIFGAKIDIINHSEERWRKPLKEVP
jgi:hypothetical protein